MICIKTKIPDEICKIDDELKTEVNKDKVLSKKEELESESEVAIVK